MGGGGDQEGSGEGFKRHWVGGRSGLATAGEAGRGCGRATRGGGEESFWAADYGIGGWQQTRPLAVAAASPAPGSRRRRREREARWGIPANADAPP